MKIYLFANICSSISFYKYNFLPVMLSVSSIVVACLVSDDEITHF